MNATPVLSAPLIVETPPPPEPPLPEPPLPTAPPVLAPALASPALAAPALPAAGPPGEAPTAAVPPFAVTPPPAPAATSLDEPPLEELQPQVQAATIANTGQKIGSDLIGSFVSIGRRRGKYLLGFSVSGPNCQSADRIRGTTKHTFP
jgi:hypothetical protein